MINKFVEGILDENNEIENRRKEWKNVKKKVIDNIINELETKGITCKYDIEEPNRFLKFDKMTIDLFNNKEKKLILDISWDDYNYLELKITPLGNYFGNNSTNYYNYTKFIFRNEFEPISNPLYHQNFIQYVLDTIYNLFFNK